MKRARLWFWLHTMDALSWAERCLRRAYLYAVGKASDATDWGEGAKLGEEEPF